MQQPYDMPLEQLYQYKPERTAPADFKEFWKDSLDELANEKAEPELELHEYPADGVKVYWLTYKSTGERESKAGTQYPTAKGRILRSSNITAIMPAMTETFMILSIGLFTAMRHSVCWSAGRTAVKIQRPLNTDMYQAG